MCLFISSYLIILPAIFRHDAIMFSLCVERDVLPADRAKYKREREVKPGGAGYRGMRIVVVRYIYDINESTINFI